jgi:SHR-binding domain of vacuolar-sorting associated protein 13
VLDADRLARGEHATRMRLANGSIIPLTLKRSLSQTCDPHRAHIHLELGSFEDTIGRVDQNNFGIPMGGSRSSGFFFKAAAKIPVDAVGVHRFALDRNLEAFPDAKIIASNSRAVGWIIVRVSLRGSVKVVSIESPLMLKSAADADLICEVRNHDSLSLLWRCVVPKEGGKHSGIVPVPADLVPFLHDGPYQLTVGALSRTHSTDVSSTAESISIRPAAYEVEIPPPFSKEKGMIKRGVVGEQELVLRAIVPPTDSSDLASVDNDEKVYLSACGIRIGKPSFSRVKSGVQIPEQRLLFFRSPLVIKNFLALPIALQIRLKGNGSTFYGNKDSRGAPLARSATSVSDWEDLGILNCGCSQNWTGSLSSDQVQIRVQIVGANGDNSRIYPEWSSPTDIPPAMHRSSRGANYGGGFAKMKVADADGVSLSLSVALETGDLDWRDSEESVMQFCESFPSATRLVSIFVPHWIVDSTQQDLEYFAGSPISGQLKAPLHTRSLVDHTSEHGHTLGLAELMDNGNSFLHSSSMPEFNVLMIGDENSSRLTVRKRHNRKGHVGSNRYMPWSEPIPLQRNQKQQHDLTVLDPQDSLLDEFESETDNHSLGCLVLRSIMIAAPERFGGCHGTKILHIVNRYMVSNETGRDIEIASQQSQTGGNYLTVNAGSTPLPLHFDDTRPICFRFKEYGWTWSGSFKIRSNHREVTMRVRHKMKPQTMIITVERVSKTAATSMLIFRNTMRPPFRLENHTMYPMQFGQYINRLNSEESHLDSVSQWHFQPVHKHFLLLCLHNIIQLTRQRLSCFY